MSEWTKEAQDRLARYLDDVSSLAREMGDDADEIAAGLAMHITAEAEALAGSVVTLEHLGKALAAVGTPAQVLGAVDPLPSLSRKKPGDADGPRWGRPIWWHFGITRGYFLGLAVLLPLFSIGFEYFTHVMAGLYIDPIPTFAHVIALVLVVAGLVAAHGFMHTYKPEMNRKRAALACIANGYATCVATVYFIVYIPMIPISFLGILAVGLGAMGFSPLFCTIAGFAHMRGLLRRMRAYGVPRMWAGKRMLAGAGIAVAFLILFSGPELFKIHVLHTAISDDAVKAAEAQDWIVRLGWEEEILEACYRPSPNSDRILFSRDSDVDIPKYRDLYYRLTGRLFSTVQIPERGEGIFLLDERSGWRRTWENPSLPDSGIGGEQVGGRERGLILESSVMDVSLAEQPCLAYIEWTMQFRNRREWENRARAEIEIPHDAVASRLTLWIEGEERDAAFGERAQVREAYRDVAVVQRRDPALLMTQGADGLSLDCFPVPGGGVMKVKIGITAPLVIRGGQAYLRLPCFSGRNFTVSPELEHKVWAECKTPLSAGSEALTAERPSNDVYAVRGVLLDTELQDPKKALIWLPAPPLGGSVVTGALGAFSAAMSLYEFKKVESPAVALVVDGSVSMSRASIDWTAVVDALPPSAEILAIHAGRTVSVWKEDFTQSADGLAEWLSSQKYEGGCDPVPALEMAWERVSAKPDAAILWIHGPLPITLSPMDGMEQWYKRRPMCANGVPVRLLSLQVLPGPNRVAESFASWTGFERVPMLASVDESLAYAATHLASQDAGRSYVLTENVGEGANSLDHVVRLAVFEEVCKACRGDAAIDKDAALKRAVRTRIVTPVSGAVVLENKSQYEQHGLDPGENLNAIPVIPEPEEWALIAVAALALAVMYRKRRKVGVHNA